MIRWARLYDPVVWVMALGQTRKLRTIPLQLAKLQPGERVLDVGCGTGGLTLAAARIVGPAGEVVGIDAAPEMIDVAARKAARARRRPINVEFSVEAVEALSFPDGTFDVVLSSLMMHHLPGDLKAQALAEIRRVLRPGGRLVVVDMQPSNTATGGKLSGGPLLWVHRRSGRQEGTILAPSSAGSGLSYLAALAQEAGLTAVESGPTSHTLIGYLTAHTPS